MNLYYKVKLNILFAHIIALVGIIFYFSWSGLAVAFVTWIIFNIGVSGGFHRLFAHKQFAAGKISKTLFLTAGSLAGIGSCISWVGQHRLHHAHSDVKGNDPYYPHEGLIRSWILGPWNINISPLSVKDLLRDPLQIFFHTHYFKIQIAWILILAYIDPIYIFWLWALPSAATFFSLQVVGVLGHMVGTQEHDTGDYSLNSHFLNIFTFGESYQNTHHQNASKLILGKFDIIGKILNQLFK
jgi:fatty-acid desaturase